MRLFQSSISEFTVTQQCHKTTLMNNRRNIKNLVLFSFEIDLRLYILQLLHRYVLNKKGPERAWFMRYELIIEVVQQMCSNLLCNT